MDTQGGAGQHAHARALAQQAHIFAVQRFVADRVIVRPENSQPLEGQRLRTFAQREHRADAALRQHARGDGAAFRPAQIKPRFKMLEEIPIHVQVGQQLYPLASRGTCTWLSAATESRNSPP